MAKNQNRIAAIKVAQISSACGTGTSVVIAAFPDLADGGRHSNPQPAPIRPLITTVHSRTKAPHGDPSTYWPEERIEQETSLGTTSQPAIPGMRKNPVRSRRLGEVRNGLSTGTNPSDGVSFVLNLARRIVRLSAERNLGVSPSTWTTPNAKLAQYAHHRTRICLASNAAPFHATTYLNRTSQL
jgi:hypothetical protein